MKLIMFVLLIGVSSIVLGDSCVKSDEPTAEETLCSQVASALRVDLHALKLLRKSGVENNADVIHYLEWQSDAKQKMLSLYLQKCDCQTRNVNAVMTEFADYWKEYTPKPDGG